MSIQRTTVDLSAYPDLVVIYLGMKAHNERGAQALQDLFPQIVQSVAAAPDGLLSHEFLSQGIMRQYWRDFASLEAWARELPHQQWWKDFLRDPAGTEFWHETYFARGGMEAIYDNVEEPLGFLRFAPNIPARGPMFSARQRLNLPGAPPPPGTSEDTLYSNQP